MGPNWDDLRFFPPVVRAGPDRGGGAHRRRPHHRRPPDPRAGGGARPPVHRRAISRLCADRGRANLLGVAETMESAFLLASAATAAALALSGTVRVGAPDGFGTFFLAPGSPADRAASGAEAGDRRAARIFSISKREADIVITLYSRAGAAGGAPSPITGCSSTRPSPISLRQRRSRSSRTCRPIPSSATSSRTCC